MAICPSCNEERNPGALFCGSCGSRLIADATAEPEVDPFVGQTLNGTYVLQQRIGSGGMGNVYRAIHNKLDVPVAVKLVKQALLEDPAVVNRFKREARAASRLRHPNVVGVTDFGQTADGTLFMVMEYVTGRSLARVIVDEGPLPEARVVHIGAQVLSALAEAHANHLLHRDLKPENVMLEARRGAPDFVKVLDFGIAKLLTADASASTLTQAGLVCGTPGYMSPEQLRGESDVDARSDLFAVGVVLYEMLTSELPFDVQTPMEMLHKHLSERIPLPSERTENPVSPALEELIMRSLSLLRGDRPKSAEVMRDELIAAAAVPVSNRDASPETQHRPATEVLPRPDRRPSPLGSPRPPSVGASTPAKGPAGGTPPPPARSQWGWGVGKAHPPSGDNSKGASSHWVAPEKAEGNTAPPAQFPAPGPAGKITPEPGGRPSPATAEHSPSRTIARPETRFDPKTLKQLEERLAGTLGPVAPHLTRRASRQASTLGELCQALSRYLPSRTDRQAFLAWSSTQFRVSPVQTQSRMRPATTPAVTWDAEVLERATRDLAVHLGPLARILVRRAAPHSRDLRELYETLASSIPGEAGRTAFWRAAPPQARQG